MNIVIERWDPTKRETLAESFKVFMDEMEVYPSVLFYPGSGPAALSCVELRWRVQNEAQLLDELHSKVRQSLDVLQVDWGEWTAVKRDGPHAGTVFAYIEVEDQRYVEDDEEKTCCKEAAQKDQPFCDCEIPF